MFILKSDVLRSNSEQRMTDQKLHPVQHQPFQQKCQYPRFESTNPVYQFTGTVSAINC